MAVKIFSLLMIVVSVESYSQKTTNILHDKYYEGIYHYLSPATKNTERELLFISLPQDGTSEYSLDMERKDDSYVLIVRKFFSCYWSDVLTNYKQDGIVRGRIKSFETNVSKDFGKLFKEYYHSVAEITPNLPDKVPQIYDGKIYLLLSNKYRREIKEFDFPDNLIYRKLAALCEEISDEMIKGTFNDDVYTNKIASVTRNH